MAHEYEGNMVNEFDAEIEGTSAGSNSLLIDGLDAETLARRFHDTYERLAPLYGYKTRKASRVDWDDVPHQNKKLMIATCQELINEGI